VALGAAFLIASPTQSVQATVVFDPIEDRYANILPEHRTTGLSPGDSKSPAHRSTNRPNLYTTAILLMGMSMLHGFIEI
jgi:hypothetical protein